MSNSFSKKVKEIISLSREEALRLGNDYISAEHFLLGILREGDNKALQILQSLHINFQEVKEKIELSIKGNAGYSQSLPLNKSAENVVHGMVAEARGLKSPKVETEHMLLSLLKNKENTATQILHDSHIGYNEAAQMLTRSFPTDKNN